jgi:hypothetical protein
MHGREAILASLPPLLAILVEVLNPVSEDLIKNEAKRVIQDEKLENQDPNVIAKTAHGAMAVASLAPTILSVVSGGLAIASELATTGFLLLAGFILTLTLLFLNLVKSLSGLSYYQIAATTRPLIWPIRTLKRVFRCKPYGPLHTKVISRFIYATNSLLLMMCLFVWILTDDKDTSAAWLKAHLEALMACVSP